MRAFSLRNSLLPALLSGLLGTLGCVHEISSEERLDRATQGPPAKDVMTAAELSKVNCQDTAAGLAKARSDSRPETERVQTYSELYEGLAKRTSLFEQAMTRNPDLAYQESSQELVSARETCIQQTADVKVEFDRYVRELVEVPTVQEIKGGNTVTVARMDFPTLRKAIELLNPEDHEQLLARVSAAEKKVETPKDTKRRGR